MNKLVNIYYIYLMNELMNKIKNCYYMNCLNLSVIKNIIY